MHIPNPQNPADYKTAGEENWSLASYGAKEEDLRVNKIRGTAEASYGFSLVT